MFSLPFSGCLLMCCPSAARLTNHRRNETVQVPFTLTNHLPMKCMHTKDHFIHMFTRKANLCLHLQTSRLATFRPARPSAPRPKALVAAPGARKQIVLTWEHEGSSSKPRCSGCSSQGCFVPIASSVGKCDWKVSAARLNVCWQGHGLRCALLQNCSRCGSEEVQRIPWHGDQVVELLEH